MMNDVLGAGAEQRGGAPAQILARVREHADRVKTEKKETKVRFLGANGANTLSTLSPIRQNVPVMSNSNDSG